MNKAEQLKIMDDEIDHQAAVVRESRGFCDLGRIDSILEKLTEAGIPLVEVTYRLGMMVVNRNVYRDGR